MATERRLRLLFGALCAVSLFAMLAVSFDYGITNDEPRFAAYGHVVWRLYASGFTDTHAFNRSASRQSEHLYGSLFELLCVAAGKLSPFSEFDTHHLVNAAVGWLGIVYAARIADRILGIRAAIVTLLLLLLSPAYLGHCFNNAKDIPFATAYVVSLFYILGTSPTYPFFTVSSAAKIALATAAAINIRVGGLMLIAYLSVLVLIRGVVERSWTFRRLIRTSVALGTVSVLAFGAAMFLWPWAMQDPLRRPFRALGTFTNLNWSGPQKVAGRAVPSAAIIYNLFDGDFRPATSVPWDYAPTLFAITSPLPILAFAMISVVGLFVLDKGRRIPFGLVWLAGVFPVAYVIARHSSLYDGIRHLLFVYPPLVIAAAVGFIMAYDFAKARGAWRWVPLGVLLLGMLDPLVFTIRHHPNQAVYFNSLIGGPGGAFKKYDMDYWANCLKQAARWVSENGTTPDHGVRLNATRGDTAALTYLSTLDLDNVIYVNDPYRAHYFIEFLRGRREYLERRTMIGQTVHSISVDGAPLCLIKEGGAYQEIAGRKGHVRERAESPEGRGPRRAGNRATLLNDIEAATTLFATPRTSLAGLVDSPDFVPHKAAIVELVQHADRFHEHLRGRWTKAVEAGETHVARAYGVGAALLNLRLLHAQVTLSLQARRAAAITPKVLDEAASGISRDRRILKAYSGDAAAVSAVREDPSELESLVDASERKRSAASDLLSTNEGIASLIAAEDALLLAEEAHWRLIRYRVEYGSWEDFGDDGDQGGAAPVTRP